MQILKTSPYWKKTIYVPYLGDYCYVLVAGMRACGMNAVILPPPDQESVEKGIQTCRGKECSPCFATMGDFVRLVQRPNFDAQRSVVFLPTMAGLCRFGQYVALLRDILDRMGLQDVEIISPSAKNPFTGFGTNPIKAFHLMWQGILAVDLLQKLVFEYRPYEREPGETDRIHQLCLGYVVTAIENGSEGQLVKAMEYAAHEFGNLRINLEYPRPRIGMIGEILVRFNPTINLDIVRKIEAAGGQIMTSSMSEWLYHAIWNYMHQLWGVERYIEWSALVLADQYQHFYERKYVKIVEHLLPYAYETPIATVVHHAHMVYDSALAYESVLNIGKAIDYAKRGASGIMNIMPFSCMPGIITSGVAPHLRARLNNIPWLDLTFDAQAETNIHTRVEAFMHQTRTYQKNHPELHP